MMTPKIYDIVYSIGYDCTCARYMGKYFLRSFAGPFDWITCADFSTRMEYILNNFENFMNKEDMVFINRPPEHDYLNPMMVDYQNTRDGYKFYHDFPKGVDFEVSFPQIKAKYDRRIKRFDDMLKTKENVLLLNLAHDEAVDNELILKYCNAIMKKYGKKIDFIFIENDKTKDKGEVEKIELSENVIKYKVRTVDPKVKGKIPLTAEACDAIFSELHSKGQAKRRWLRYWHKFWVKTVSLFIFYKPWRKKFKLKHLKV